MLDIAERLVSWDRCAVSNSCVASFFFFLDLLEWCLFILEKTIDPSSGNGL